MPSGIQLICLATLLIIASLAISHDVVAQISGIRRYANTVQQEQKKKKLSAATRGKLMSSYVRRYMTFGGSVSALHYIGDIAPESSFGSTDASMVRPGLGVSSSFRLSARFSMRLEMLYGQLSGSDYAVTSPEDFKAVYRYVRNLHFRNNIKDLSCIVSYDLFSNPHAIILRPFFTPYFFAGLSVFHHNPKAKVPHEAVLYPGEMIIPEKAGEWIALRPLKTEGQARAYSAFQLSIPLGIGMRVKIHELIDVEAELTHRYLFTDYLDDISNKYADKGALESELAKILSDRSLESTDAWTSKERVDAMLGEQNMSSKIITYTGSDDRQYTVIAGYGQAEQIRGSPKYKDSFMVATIRLVIIVGENPWARKNRF